MLMKIYIFSFFLLLDPVLSSATPGYWFNRWGRGRKIMVLSKKVFLHKKRTDVLTDGLLHYGQHLNNKFGMCTSNNMYHFSDKDKKTSLKKRIMF